MKQTKVLYAITLLLMLLPASCSADQARLDAAFESASAKMIGNKLVVDTGKVERQWELTDYGLKTIYFNGFKDTANSKEVVCDWEYYGLIDKTTPGRLISITSNISDDEGFTCKHLEVIAEFEYPSVESFVKYQIWVYPDSEGIFTRLWLKGKASQYTKIEAGSDSGISFKRVSGQDKYDYGAHGASHDYIARHTLHDKKIEYLINGLDPKKSYKVGLSWWDFPGAGKKQQVRVTSVDGETEELVIKAKMLPDYKNKKQKHEELTFDLPSSVLLDGSFRLCIDKLAGDKANLSEIWIFEKDQKLATEIYGDIERIDKLRDTEPGNYALIAYANCGDSKQLKKPVPTGRVDYLPVSGKGLTRRYAGYFNDTQHRNTPETPLIREVVFNKPVSDSEEVDWANIACLEKDSKGVILVKESYKCVNQYGHDTGAFKVSSAGVENTGTSLKPKEILPDRYRKCWASWMIAYQGSDNERELALKKFDRIRFPVDPKRDIYIQANTWGSGRNRDAADEKTVLKEIQTQKQLGIDIQQIDDGWQTKGWSPQKSKYPDGWKNVVQASKQSGVKLGLWAAAWAPLKDLKRNYDQGKFISYKLDFAGLNNHHAIENMMAKARKFILYTNHNVRINWDVTENAARFGYFWAREYGCIYLENRKPDLPANVVYIPHLVLRDIWQLSKYCNLNKFQTSIQNIDRTNKEHSDAYLHNHPYSVAIALMGTPLFFQETSFYSNQAREQISKLLSIYKTVRNDIYDCYIFPIGDKPDNASWSGFQAYNPSSKTGYLMIYRELNNRAPEKQMALRFLKNKKLKLTDLVNSTQSEVKTGPQGQLKFKIDKPADFRFIKYTQVK